jgi:hypothetical protein
MAHDPPGPTRAELAREVLLHRMRDYSEEFHCAGWLSGLEVLLWEIPEEDDRTWVQARREISMELRTLAEIAEGWWAWNDEVPGGDNPVFVPLAEWKKWLAKRAADR